MGLPSMINKPTMPNGTNQFNLVSQLAFKGTSAMMQAGKYYM
jgi:hypothetical protein